MGLKKILILCFLGDPTLPSGSLSGTGGFNASAKDLLDILSQKRGLDCIFVTNTTGNYNQPLTEKIGSNIVLHRVYSSPKNWLNRNSFSEEIPLYINAVETIIDDFSNISFIHSFYWLSGMIAESISKKFSIPFIHTTVSLAKQKILSGYNPDIVNQIKYENVFLNRAKHILAITEDEKKLLTKEYNIPSEKIIVEGQSVAKAFHFPIYDDYGIPLNISENNRHFKPIGFNDLDISEAIWWNSGAFTYVGRIIQIKGIDFIIKAWMNLDIEFKGKIPPLWIIGSTPYEIEKFRKDLNIPLDKLLEYETNKRIVWWGYLTPEAISTLYLKTSVLVTHSRYEAGGRVILEALCQGIPVISTNVGFGKDYINNWLNGFVVEYGKVKELEFRMSHFIMNPLLASTLGGNAKEVFRKLEKNWNHTTQIINLYEALLERKEYYFKHKSSYTPKINYFDMGIIEAYPYYYQKPSIEQIVKIVNNDLALQNKVYFKDFHELYSSDIWIYKEKYAIKYICPKLNKDKIWNNFELHNAWSGNEILNKLLTICKFPSILPPIMVYEDKLLLIMPFLRIFSEREYIQNLDDIAQCLKKLSSVSVPNHAKGMTLCKYWNSLCQNIINHKNSRINAIYEMVPERINTYMSTPDNFTGKICIQYSHPIYENIGLYNNKIFLLPIRNWKYVQLGLDAGILLSEQLRLRKTFNYESTKNILQNLSDIFKISSMQILSGCLCYCTENLIKKIFFKDTETVFDTELLVHIITAMNNLL